MDEIMKCGHIVYEYELMKSDGIVYIQYKCEEGCKTELGIVGEAPYPDDIEIDG